MFINKIESNNYSIWLVLRDQSQLLIYYIGQPMAVFKTYTFDWLNKKINVFIVYNIFI